MDWRSGGFEPEMRLRPVFENRYRDRITPTHGSIGQPSRSAYSAQAMEVVRRRRWAPTVGAFPVIGPRLATE